MKDASSGAVASPLSRVRARGGVVDRIVDHALSTGRRCAPASRDDNGWPMVSPLAVLAERGQRFIAESDPVALLDMACRTIREETGAALAIAAIFDDSSARPASDPDERLRSGIDRAPAIG